MQTVAKKIGLGMQWVYVGKVFSNVIRLDCGSKWQNTLFVWAFEKTNIKM